MSDALQNLLRVASVADAVDADAVSILRLVSRGTLKAIELQPGNFRILADEVIDWVAKGAQDLRIVSEPGPIETVDYRHMAKEFVREVIRGLEPLFWSGQAVEERARREAPGSPAVSLSRGLNSTPAIDQAAAGSPRSAFKEPGRPYDLAWRDYFAAEQVRLALHSAFQAWRGRPKNKLPALAGVSDTSAWLYGRGPEAYKAAVDEAIETVAAGSIFTERVSKFPALSAAAPAMIVTVRYSISHSALGITRTGLGNLLKRIL
jgi:hypothetical protein